MTEETATAILDLQDLTYQSCSLTNRELFRAGYRTAMFWANSYTGEDDTFECGTDSPDFYDSESPAELTAALNQQADDFLDDPTVVELIAAAIEDQMVSYGDFGQAGQDFALSRNGQEGFTDRGIDQGAELHEMAKPYGPASIWIENPDDPSTWTLEEG